MLAPLYRGGRVAYVPSSRPPLSYDALNQHWFNFWSGWRRVSINVFIHIGHKFFFKGEHVRFGIHPTRKHFVAKIIYNKNQQHRQIHIQ